MKKLIVRQYDCISELQHLWTQLESSTTQGEATRAKDTYLRVTKLWIEINENHESLEKLPNYETLAVDYQTKNPKNAAAGIIGDIFIIMEEKCKEIPLTNADHALIKFRKKHLLAIEAEEEENKRQAEILSAGKSNVNNQKSTKNLANNQENQQINNQEAPINSINAQMMNLALNTTDAATSTAVHFPPAGNLENLVSDSNDPIILIERQAARIRKEVEELKSKRQERQHERSKNQQQNASNRNQEEATLSSILEKLVDICSNNSMNDDQLEGRYSKMKSKPIEFPTFDGDILKYASFKTNFNRLAEECNLGIAHRYLTLRSSLSEKVLRTVAKIDDVPENYDAVWKKLDERFYNRRLILSNIVAQLFDAPQTIPGDSESYTELLDCISAFEINLKFLGYQHNETSDASIAITVLSRLSEECEQRLSDSIPDKKAIYKLEDIVKFLEAEALHWMRK